MTELLKGYFTVPNDVPDQRVVETMDDYINRYAQSYEKEGWKLASKIVYGKIASPIMEDVLEGRTRWAIWANWVRKPVTHTVEVDEKYIPKLQATGKFTDPIRGLYPGFTAIKN